MLQDTPSEGITYDINTGMRVMKINIEQYRSKVLACWLGKTIGGTLGAPFEWQRRINDVQFYTQDLKGEPLPNDDLDIQLLWLIALEEQGIKLDAHILSEYWQLYVTPHWSEYGTAKVNLRAGLQPPLSGAVNNIFKDSCGAFIRSEIWACIAPGCPKIAVEYALQDAIIDHGNGEGTFAEVFCAAFESAAFVENDIFKLIKLGLSYIPSGCGVAKAVKHVVDCYESKKTWQETRNEILQFYRGRTVPFLEEPISQEDIKRGFEDGPLGWDVPSNIAIVIIGLLYGEGDFSRSVCIAVNCGEDTDCTAATVGSIYGILHGAEAIPKKWIKPIGKSIKTACLNLGELGWFGSQLPQNVDELAERIERIALQVLQSHNTEVKISMTESTEISKMTTDETVIPALNQLKETVADFIPVLNKQLKGPIFKSDFFEVQVDYGQDPLIYGRVKKVIITVSNRYKIQENINFKWYLPDGWEVSPSPTGRFFLGVSIVESPPMLTFKLKAVEVKRPLNRFVIEFTMEGRHTVMLVPVVLCTGYESEH